MKKKNFMFYAKILALFLIPSMYTVTYLASNSDPYAKMNEIPVGIINLDQGYLLEDEELNIGQEVTEGMIESNGFKFEEVKEKEFTYDKYFMKITIPENFSKNIADFQNNNFEQAKIEVEVEESKNYIFASIAQEALFQMQSETNNDIVKNYLSITFQALDISIDILNDYNEKISNFIEITSNSIDQTQYEVNTEINNIKSKYSNLKINSNEQYEKIRNDFKNDVNLINDKVALLIKDINTNFEQIYQTFLDFKGKVEDKTNNKYILNLLDNINKNFLAYQKYLTNKQNDITSIKTSLETDYLQPIEESLTTDIKNLEKAIEDKTNEVELVWENSSQEIDYIQNKVLNNKFLEKQITLEGNVDNMITFFAVPTVFEANRTNKVNSYGEGLAPFFISLSLFVGALLIMTVLPFNEVKKELKNLTFLKTILFYGMFSLGQVLLLFALLISINDLTFIHPLIFLTYSFLVSFFFIILLLFLTITLDDIGKFLAFILLVLQLGGSAGTFPIETAPKFFQFIHPFLPMSYTVIKYRQILFVENVSILTHGIFLVVVSSILLLSLKYYVQKKSLYTQ